MKNESIQKHLSQAGPGPLQQSMQVQPMYTQLQLGTGEKPFLIFAASGLLDSIPGYLVHMLYKSRIWFCV